jgi:hypothetical protein
VPFPNVKLKDGIMLDYNKLLCPEVNVETKSTVVMNEGGKDKYTRVRGNTSP